MSLGPQLNVYARLLGYTCSVFCSLTSIIVVYLVENIKLDSKEVRYQDDKVRYRQYS